MNSNLEQNNTEQSTEHQLSETNQLRADIYQLLAALFRQAPSNELLEFLANIELESTSENEMSLAWSKVKTAASNSNSEQLEDEYFAVFLGVGCGEILPYGSWFISGSLMDKPLALLRQDLKQLGYERDDNVAEPEDHVAALLEVMGDLILSAPQFRQLAFYQRHMESWIIRFCDDLSKAPSAAFYQSIAQLAKAFFELEAREFEQLNLNIPVNCPNNMSANME